MSPLESLSEPFFLLGRVFALVEDVGAQPLCQQMIVKPRRTLGQLLDFITSYADDPMMAEVRAHIACIDVELKEFEGASWNYLIWTIHRPVNMMWIQFGYDFQRVRK
jgi:hypothetical protein